MGIRMPISRLKACARERALLVDEEDLLFMGMKPVMRELTSLTYPDSVRGMRDAIREVNCRSAASR